MFRIYNLALNKILLKQAYMYVKSLILTPIVNLENFLLLKSEEYCILVSFVAVISCLYLFGELKPN